MTWHAKPSGYYSYTSQEGLDNIYEMNDTMGGATLESRAAVIANSFHEGGLNPWRWQGDRFGLSRGYGLFQFTPASGYINSSWPTKAPNMSTTEVTTGADPSDGEAQCEVMATDYLNKWVSNCWRSYWSQTTYSDLYAYRGEVLRRWGSGSSISMQQFFQCQDLDAATFIFLACFEGPAVPNFSTRKATAAQIYQILGGIPPTPPTPPTPPDPPTPPVGSDIPYWLIKKMKDKRRKI